MLIGYPLWPLASALGLPRLSSLRPRHRSGCLSAAIIVILRFDMHQEAAASISSIDAHTLSQGRVPVCIWVDEGTHLHMLVNPGVVPLLCSILSCCKSKSCSCLVPPKFISLYQGEIPRLRVTTTNEVSIGRNDPKTRLPGAFPGNLRCQKTLSNLQILMSWLNHYFIQSSSIFHLF